MKRKRKKGQDKNKRSGRNSKRRSRKEKNRNKKTKKMNGNRGKKKMKRELRNESLCLANERSQHLMSVRNFITAPACPRPIEGEVLELLYKHQRFKERFRLNERGRLGGFKERKKVIIFID